MRPSGEGHPGGRPRRPYCTAGRLPLGSDAGAVLRAKRMKIPMSIAAGVAGAALLSACAGKPAPAARPAPAVVRQAPAPAAPPPVETSAADWRDRPLTPGDWSYDS